MIDVIVVVVLLLVVLVFLDWSQARRFRIHEEVERQANASLALTAESAAGVALRATNEIRVLQAQATLHRTDISNIAEQVRMHDQRLGAVEERVMRAALMVPPMRRENSDG